MSPSACDHFDAKHARFKVIWIPAGDRSHVIYDDPLPSRSFGVSLLLHSLPTHRSNPCWRVADGPDTTNGSGCPN